MTRSTRARRVLAAAALTAFAVALTAGCGTGQLAQTALQVPSVPGANAEATVSDGKRILLRNAFVEYSPTGYPQGATVPLELRLYNETGQPIRLVEVSSPDGQVLSFGGAGASPSATATSSSAQATGSPSATASRTASPGPGSASPTGSPSPTRSPQATGRPVDIEVPAGGFVVLSRTSGQFLQLVGLGKQLRLGQTVTLTFRFNNGTKIEKIAVPLTPPSSPAPRSPMVFKEGEGGHD